MNPTDRPYRFYVAEIRVSRHPRFEVRDRTGFLPAAEFHIGISGNGRDARERAITVAKGRNQCEIKGAHTFTGGGCEVCDASTKPEVHYIP